MRQRGAQHRAAAERRCQPGCDLDRDGGVTLRQFQQRAGHAVDTCIAGADQCHRFAALRCFQRPAAAVDLFGHAGGVHLFVRVQRAHKVDVNGVAAQHIGGLQGGLGLGGQKPGISRAKAHHVYKVTHRRISNPAQRGAGPQQRSRRRAPICAPIPARLPPARRHARTRYPRR